MSERALRIRRWDACFIRLLDGMLQAGAMNITLTDTQLRIPTGIRRLAILDPSPMAATGSEGACVPCCARRNVRRAHRAPLASPAPGPHLCPGLVTKPTYTNDQSLGQTMPVLLPQVRLHEDRRGWHALPQSFR